MTTPPSDPRASRRDRLFIAVLGAVLGGAAPFAVSILATAALAVAATLCLGVAAFGSDRLIARITQIFTGWP